MECHSDRDRVHHRSPPFVMALLQRHYKPHSKLVVARTPCYSALLEESPASRTTAVDGGAHLQGAARPSVDKRLHTHACAVVGQ